jgi:hypothetical protein
MFNQIKSLYDSNKIVQICTNGTVILSFVAVVYQGYDWTVSTAEEKLSIYATSASVQALQKEYNTIIGEQQSQREILVTHSANLAKQTRQLNFIYYDSLKREIIVMEREVFALNSNSNRNGIEDARLHELIGNLNNLRARFVEVEKIIRGHI